MYDVFYDLVDEVDLPCVKPGMSRRKSIQLSWMKPCSNTSSCRVRQKQKTSKSYAPMPLQQPLQDCSRHMGSTTMRSWHGKVSRMLLHGSANRHSLHPFGSFSRALKRKRIPALPIIKIHLNGKRITRHEVEFFCFMAGFFRFVCDTHGFRKQRSLLYILSLCCKPIYGISTVTAIPYRRNSTVSGMMDTV